MLGKHINVIWRPWRNSTNAASQRFFVSYGKIAAPTSVSFCRPTQLVLSQWQSKINSSVLATVLERRKTVPTDKYFLQLIHGMRTSGGCQLSITGRMANLTSIPGRIWLWTMHFGVEAYTRQRPNCETNRLLDEAEKRRRRKEREMRQHLHLSILSGTSCPHCNKICRSRIGLLSHLETHDRLLEDVILVSGDHWRWYHDSNYQIIPSCPQPDRLPSYRAPKYLTSPGVLYLFVWSLVPSEQYNTTKNTPNMQ